MCLDKQEKKIFSQYFNKKTNIHTYKNNPEAFLQFRGFGNLQTNHQIFRRANHAIFFSAWIPRAIKIFFRKKKQLSSRDAHAQLKPEAQTLLAIP